MSTAINKIGRVKSLKIGKGLQYLLDEAYEIFNNPILIHDLEFKVIACTENRVDDDPIWEEITSFGKLHSETIELLKKESLLDIAANTSSIALLKTDKLKYDRIFGKICNKEQIIVAAIDIISCYKPFEEGEFEAFEIFCGKIRKEFARIDYYITYGRVFQQRIIKSLIEGTLEDKQLYSIRIGNIYADLKTNLYLGIVSFKRCEGEFKKIDDFLEFCKEQKPTIKYFIYENQIIMIISSNTSKFNKDRDLGRLKEIFEKYKICVGISGRFENLYELSRHYRDALKVLDNGLKSDGSGTIFQYSKDASPRRKGNNTYNLCHASSYYSVSSTHHS